MSDSYILLKIKEFCILSIYILQKLTKSVIIRNMKTLNNKKNKDERIKASDLPNYLLSHGITSITTNEIADILRISPNHVPQRMQALKKKNMIVAPAKGLWIPIPPEYMTWGALPAIDMINSLMKHLEVSFYVGWLSAAAYLGASHHAPQVFQVAVSRSIRNRVIGRSDIRFYHRSNIVNINTILIESRSGKVPISSRETTLLDIANDVSIAGGLDNTANLAIELCDAEKPQVSSIAYLSRFYPASASRRLGWLLENFTDIKDVDLLKKEISTRDAAASVLDPLSDKIGIIDYSWNLKINRVLDPDV